MIRYFLVSKHSGSPKPERWSAMLTWHIQLRPAIKGQTRMSRSIKKVLRLGLSRVRLISKSVMIRRVQQSIASLQTQWGLSTRATKQLYKWKLYTHLSLSPWKLSNNKNLRFWLPEFDKLPTFSTFFQQYLPRLFIQSCKTRVFLSQSNKVLHHQHN